MLHILPCKRNLVREHIPLEQGLRPYWICRKNNEPNIVREHIPLEQGLRRQIF